MYLTGLEDFRTLYADPGENAGWMTGCGNVLVSAGQTPLWHFADDVDRALTTNEGPLGGTGTDEAQPFLYADDKEHLTDLPIKRIVLENFRLYPWKAQALRFDEFRTVRLIGALQFMARKYDLEFHTQPALIKEQAELGGVESFFLRPLTENRHTNDAMRHWWYYVMFGPDGCPSVIEESKLHGELAVPAGVR